VQAYSLRFHLPDISFLNRDISEDIFTPKLKTLSLFLFLHVRLHVTLLLIYLVLRLGNFWYLSLPAPLSVHIAVLLFMFSSDLFTCLSRKNVAKIMKRIQEFRKHCTNELINPNGTEPFMRSYLPVAHIFNYFLSFIEPKL
jgi:hypothetical protein